MAIIDLIMSNIDFYMTDDPHYPALAGFTAARRKSRIEKLWPELAAPATLSEVAGGNESNFNV